MARSGMSQITLQIRVSGRVQGVGYRDALRREAERNAIRGWVRNRSDGSVEALLQGESRAVEKIITWAREGPPAARVAQVRTDVPEEEFDRSYAAFECWPSA